MGSGKDRFLAQLEKFFGSKDSLDTYVKLGIVVLLFLCFFTRICIYLSPKDMWLDGAALYNGINSEGWLGLLQGKLRYMQIGPLLFILFNKFIITYLGHSSPYIYFLPFFCSMLSVVMLFLVSRKVGDSFYVFSTLLIFSFCFTPVYYSSEFKQYSTELFISAILLYIIITSLDRADSDFLSLKKIFLYCTCILFSSSAVLFLAGILSARILIAWRRGALRAVMCNWWKVLFLLAFIAVYYFFFLKAGNSEGMKKFWKPFFIPLSWGDFCHYWSTTGIGIFQALFPPSTFAAIVFLGLVGGCLLLWRKRKDFFLLFSLPVVVTLVANSVFYPPGHGGAPHGGRLLLFLVPNAVLVAGWFYACLLRRLGSLLASWGDGLRGLPHVRSAPPMVFLCILVALVGASVVANARYLYSREYYVQQVEELIGFFRCNATPGSLNLVYGPAVQAYRYYQQDAPRLPIEVLPWEFGPVKARLEHLPESRRVLLLISHYWRIGERGLSELEDSFTRQGREYVKIPAKGAVLYILPKMS